jgi:hypothetical protein
MHGQTQIPHVLYERFYPGLRGVERATHRLSCGTAENTAILAEFFRGVLQLFDASFWFETL